MKASYLTANKIASASKPYSGWVCENMHAEGCRNHVRFFRWQVIQPSRLKLTVWTTTFMTWSILNDLKYYVSWCKIQWNVQKLCPPFAACTFSQNFVCSDACFSPDHWWCAICSHTDSTGPFHFYPVQHFNERAKNVIRCSMVAPLPPHDSWSINSFEVKLHSPCPAPWGGC